MNEESARAFYWLMFYTFLMVVAICWTIFAINMYNYNQGIYHGNMDTYMKCIQGAFKSLK